MELLWICALLLTAVGSFILFSVTDKFALKLFQAVSEKITRNTGKDCYDIARLISIIGSGLAVAVGAVNLLLLGKESTVSDIVFSIAFSGFMLGVSLWVVRLGRRSFRENNGDEIAIDMRAHDRMERVRLYCYLYGSYQIMFIFVFGEIDRITLAYFWSVGILVSYFSSCKPYPKSKVRIFDKLLAKLRGIIPEPASSSAQPVQISN